MSKHCHHKCEHKEVKFCADCNKVYCAGCKEEWEAPCRQNHYPWTLITQQTTPRYPMPYPVWYSSSSTEVKLIDENARKRGEPREPVVLQSTGLSMPVGNFCVHQ